MKYRIRQRGCSLTHSVRTRSARDRNNFLGRGFFWGRGIFWIFFGLGNCFLGGGIFWIFWSLTPFFFCENLIVRVKLGHPPNFNFLGKPLLGEKYVEGRRNNNAKFSGHYVYPRTETVRAHALRSHQ